MIAEKEVVLTYVLQLLTDQGLLSKLAFKGGTCIRKMFIGAQGRFSTDLDFTSLTDEAPDDLILELMRIFEQSYHGLKFDIPDRAWYTTSGGLSWAVNPVYRHEWNDGESQFEFQVSNREMPTLKTDAVSQLDQSYFKHLPFTPVKVACLSFPEILAEKIRACYQRDKARDVFDLGLFAKTPMNQNLLRRLVVLKLWQAHSTFEPDALFSKFQDERGFDWDDLRQLVRKNHRIEPNKILSACSQGYAFLRDLSGPESVLSADRHQRERTLWEKLRLECQEMR